MNKIKDTDFISPYLNDDPLFLLYTESKIQIQKYFPIVGVLTRQFGGW